MSVERTAVVGRQSVERTAVVGRQSYVCGNNWTLKVTNDGNETKEA